MELKELLKKVVMLGDGAVGKTSLTARYVVNKFDDKYIATIGTKVSKKDMQLTKPNLIINLRLMIWDILGQKEYSKIRTASLSGAQGVILVGDLTRPETVKSLDDVLDTGDRVGRGQDPDGPHGQQVRPRGQGLRVRRGPRVDRARAAGTRPCSASAKTGENVEDVFATLGEMLVADVVASRPKNAEEAPQTLAEVVDFIIQDFCAQYGDLEKAMLIVQHQFEEAGVDIRKPSREAVLQALEGLAKAEELSLTKTVAAVNLEERQRMVVLAKG